jgi:hypothetical protein
VNLWVNKKAIVCLIKSYEISTIISLSIVKICYFTLLKVKLLTLKELTYGKYFHSQNHVDSYLRKMYYQEEKKKLFKKDV